VELTAPIPFAEDTVHRTYDPEAAHRFWRVLMRVDQVFQRFSSGLTKEDLWRSIRNSGAEVCV
jgi:hypothetical protein